MTKNTEEAALDEAAETGAAENEQKKADSTVAYERTLERVVGYEKMTSTPAWKDFYAEIRAKVDEFKAKILTLEKTRAIIRCQEGACLYEKLFDTIKREVQDLNAMEKQYPLFKDSFLYSSEFDEQLGVVSVKKKEESK